MLIEPLTDEQLNTVYSEILSPLAWDLGHIANFEELWLVQRVGGREPLDGELGRLYDAIQNPRKTRNELPLLRNEALRSYMDQVRARTLGVLDGVELDGDDPLLADGFVYEMLIAHEHQHNETMLQLLQLVPGYPRPGREPGVAAEPVAAGPEMVELEGGAVEVGAGPAGFAYDNERPRHEVELRPYAIDRAPVTNDAFAGYVSETGAEPPMFWERDAERLARLALRPPRAHRWAAPGHARELGRRRPSYAAWAGKRLADGVRVGGTRRPVPTSTAPTSTGSRTDPRLPAPMPTEHPTPARCR